jgi:hypothetical protein
MADDHEADHPTALVDVRFLKDPGYAIPPYDDEPSFPEPFLGIYRRMVSQAEAEVAVIPGAGVLTSMLIRKTVRDYISGLMADRQQIFDVRVVCANCGTTVVRPWWPHRDARMMASYRELLKQIRAADLGDALRTEFVVDLAQETLRAIDANVEDPADRARVKEAVRTGFQAVLNDFATRRLKAQVTKGG